MADAEKKGLTVKIDADLHAEVRQYLDAHEMTMAEFVTLALQDELHPKNNMKEGNTICQYHVGGRAQRFGGLRR